LILSEKCGLNIRKKSENIFTNLLSKLTKMRYRKLEGIVEEIIVIDNRGARQENLFPINKKFLR